MCWQKVKDYFGFGPKVIIHEPNPVPVPVPVKREVKMSTTTFRRSENDRRYYWHTQSPNGDIIGDSGQGYASLEDSINGFMAQQGYSDWVPGQPLPEGYLLNVNPNINEAIIEKTETRIIN